MCPLSLLYHFPVGLRMRGLLPGVCSGVHPGREGHRRLHPGCYNQGPHLLQRPVCAGTPLLIVCLLSAVCYRERHTFRVTLSQSPLLLQNNGGSVDWDVLFLSVCLSVGLFVHSHLHNIMLYITIQLVVNLTSFPDSMSC